MRTPLTFSLTQLTQLIRTIPLKWTAFIFLIMVMVQSVSGQTIAEVEPNNTLPNAVANGQDRIYQPTTITGTVSSGDDDYWLIGYDFSLNFGGDARWWLFFDGDIPAGLTVERGLLNSIPTDVYEGTEGSFTAPFSECATFEYTSSFTSIYTYLRIRSTDGATRNYSITVVERSSAQDACFGAVDPRESVVVPCVEPTAPSLAGVTRTSTTTLRLNSFPTVSDADGYIVQISDNGTFDALLNQYDEAYTGTPNTTYSGSGNQVVAQMTTPGVVDVSGLTQGTAYTFKVTPYNNCLSFHSMGTAATVVESTCGTAPTSVVSNFSTTSNATNAITLGSFNAATGANGYVAYINTTNTFTAPTILPATSTTYNGSGQQAFYAGASTTPNVTVSGSGITAGATTYVKIYAYNLCNGVYYFESVGASTTVSVCPGAPSAAPASLSINNFSHSSVNVAAIAPVASASGYVVLANTTSSFTTPTDGSLPSASAVYGGSGEQVVYAGTSSTPNVSVTGLDNTGGGVTYFFKAFAYHSCEGNIYFESTGVEASATTRGAVQTVASGAIFFEVGDGFMDLKSFTAAAGATGYVVKMNTTNSFTAPADGSAALPTASVAYAGGEQVVYAGTSVSPDFRITGLSAATTYQFAIYTYSDVDGLLYYNQTAYEFSQQNVKPTPSITFGDLTRIYGDAAFLAGASSNSTGTLTYSLVSQTNGGSAIAANGVVTVGNVGSVLIQVDQVADATYNPGTAQATLNIYKANPILQFDPVTVAFGTADQILTSTAQVVGSSASASTGTISYTIEGSAPSGNALSGTNNEAWTTGDAGTFTMRASIAADANHNAGFTDALFTVAAPSTLYVMADNRVTALVNGVASNYMTFTGSWPGTNATAFNLLEGALWSSSRAGSNNGKGAFIRQELNGTSPSPYYFPTSPSVSTVHSISSADGKIWMVTNSGGASSLGEIYSRDIDGSNTTLVHAFDATGLISPITEITEFGGVLYGTCSFDIVNAVGGIYSLTPDGMGGYTYAVEHTFTASDNNRYPAYGFVVHDNLLWYTNSLNYLVAYDPATNTFPHSLNVGNNLRNVIQANNKLYVANETGIFEINSAYTSFSSVYSLASIGIANPGKISFDGNNIYGIANTSGTGVVYKVNLDGSGFETVYTNPTANQLFVDQAINYVAKLDPVITFSDQTVGHLSVTTLNATSNSTGAITYELISDATASGLSGNQFTAGNVGTVTVRARLAEDINFNAATKDVTFTIGKIDPTFAISDLTVPFASAVQTLAPASTNYAGGTVTYAFLDGSSQVATGPNTGSTISGDQLTVLNPGNETLRANLPGTSNFNAAIVDFQLTVNNATADLSGFVDQAVQLFQSDVTLSVPTAPGIAVSYELLTSNTGSSLSGTNNETLIIGNVSGTETIRVTVNEANYVASTKDVTLTVNKVTPVLTWPTPADIAIGVVPLDATRLNASANIPGTFDYFIGVDELGTPITPGTTTMPGLGAATLTAQFLPTDNANYASTTTSVNINVTKVDLEITADNMVWVNSQAEPVLTYTITSGGIIPSHQAFIPLTRGSNNALGTYSINIDVTRSGPWIDPFGEDESICAPGLCIANGGGTIVVQTTFYNITFIPGTFTITDKPQISASDVTFNPPVSLTYDATAKTYTLTPSGSLSPALPVADLDLTYIGRNGTSYASSATAPTNAGDYTATATVKASNVDYGGSVTHDFTIAQAVTSIALNLPGSNPLYNGSGQGISPTANDVSSNPTLSLTTEYSVSGANTFSQTLPVNAGAYDVRVNLAASETNYTAPEATGVFTIDQTPQSITFNAIPEVACGQTTIDLTAYASSSSGATLTFASDNTAVVTVLGNTATIVGAGSATITASQAGDVNSAAAVDQTHTLTVAASQESFSVDNPADVTICNGGAYTLPALSVGDYFSGPGGTGTPYHAGDMISVATTLYVYGVSATSNMCMDENSFSITIDNLPVDQLSNVVAPGSYTLPALTNGNYFTTTGGAGMALSAGDVISSSQTIYIYNENAVTGCTRESSFEVTIETSTALHFEQVTNFVDYDYLSVPDNNSLDFTTSFTYEAWVNFDQLNVSAAGFGWRSLFQKSRYTDSYGLMVYGPSKLMRFYHAGVGAGFTDYTWSSLTAGAWHHVAVKWDGTNSKTSILIDGAEVSSNTSVTGTLPVNVFSLLIGSSDNRGNDPYPFDGAMDEIRFWNVARTDAEINDNKGIKLTGSESGLVVYYNFDEGTINGDNSGLAQVTDRSGNNNHASFNRFALTGAVSNYVDGSGNGVISGLPQTITFNALANKTFGDADFNLTATASSGLGVTYSSSNTAVATVSGNAVTIVGVGTTTITASQAGDATYLAAANENQDLTIDPFNTTIALNLPGTNPTYTGVGQGILPTATDVDGNPTLSLVTEYSVQGANTYGATIPTDAGIYDVRSSLNASETNYSATESTGTFTIAKAPLTVTLDDASVVYGVSGNNNHPATYTGFVNGETESVLTITVGSPTVIFLDVSNSFSYYAVGGPYTDAITWLPDASTDITSSNYAITFVPGNITSVTPRPINVTANNRTVTYGADANTGNTITIEANNNLGKRGLASGETAANFTGATTFDNITLTGVATHTGAIIPNGGLTNSNYAITYLPGNLTIDKATLTVKAQNIDREYAATNPTVTVFEYTGFQHGDGTDGDTDITGLAGLSGMAAGTIAASADAMAAPGSTHAITVDASGLSSTNYLFAGDNTGALSVTKANQIITFDVLADKMLGDVDFSLSATASSGLSVTYSSSNEAVATISGNTVTIVGVGATNITATQLGDANYNAAPDVIQSFTVNKANQTITFEALANQAFGNATLSLGATTSSGLSVTYTSSDETVATVSGNTVTIVGVGTTNITASQAGDASYDPAPDVVQPLTVNHGNYERYFVKVHSIYGMTDANEPILVKTFSTSEGQNIEALAKVGNQIWGTANQGGANSSGTLFRMDPDGTNFEVLHDFTVAEGSPRNDMAVVNDATVFGVTGDYGVFSISVASPGAGPTFYNGYTGTNQFTTGLAYRRDQLWTIDDNLNIVGISIDFSGHESRANLQSAAGVFPATDFVVEGYQLAANPATTNGVATAYWPHAIFDIKDFQSWEWSVMNDGLPNFIPVPVEDINQTKMLYDGEQYYTAIENLENFGLQTLVISELQALTSATSVFRGSIPAFNADIASNPIASLSKPYVNIYDVQDSVVWGLRGDAANGLFEAFSYDLKTTQYLVHDFGGGNLNPGVPNASFFSFRKVATLVTQDQTKVYGTANPTYTFDIWGLDAGDDASTIGGVAMNARGLFGASFQPINTVTTSSHPGQYVIMATADTLNGKYDLRHNYGKLTITYDIQPSDITFSPATASYSYDGTAKSFTTVGKAGTPAGSSGIFADLSGGSLTATDFDYTYSASTDGGTTYTIDLGTTAPSDAGTYRVTATVKSANAVYSGSVTHDFTITPVAITVTPNTNQSKTFDGQGISSDPTLTYLFTPALQGSDAFTGALTRVAGSDANTYNIEIGTLSAGNNYALILANETFEITPLAITVTPEANQIRVYDGTGVAGDAAITYANNPALLGADVFTGALTRAAGSDVNTYAIAIGTLSAGGNYALTVAAENFEITPLSITVTPDANQSKTYDGMGIATDPTLTYAYSPSLVGADTFTGALTRVDGSDASTYAIESGTLTAGSNYTLSLVAETFEITAKAVTVTANAGQAKTYGVTDPANYTFTPTPALLGGDTFTGAMTRITGENVDTYVLQQGTLTAGSNYALTFVSNDFTINPVALAITADDKSKIIGGADPALTYTITSGALVGSEMLSGALTRVAGETVGDFAIQQGTLDAGGNYAISFTDGTFTITDKIPQVITFNALAPVTYADAPVMLSATGGASGNPITYTSSNIFVANVSGNMVRFLRAGTVTITANQAGDATYAAAASVSQVLTINPRPITITADVGQTKVYGQADPALTYEITSGSLQIIDQLQGELSRVAGNDVGTYAIEQGTLTNSNYDITFVSNDFSITPRAVTVTADAGQNKVYGQTDPLFTYQANPALEMGDSFTGALTRVVGENAGDYAIEQGTLANSNYTITFVSDDFNVQASPITVTADVASKVYGDADPAFTYQVTTGMLQGSDALTGDLTRAVGENVGAYAIQQGALANSNYAITFVSQNMSITPRAITVAAEAKSKTYGEADPAFTHTIQSGVLQGSDAFSGALTRIAGENAGTYAIQQGTLDLSSNYSLTYVGDDFTINPIGLAILADDKTKFQGTADPALTYTVTSGALLNGDMIIGALTRPFGESVGIFPIQQGTLTAGGNYNINFTEGDFTITDKLLQTITFNSLSDVTYGDASFNLSATGGASGNLVSFTGDNPTVATVSATGTVTIVGVGMVNITANQPGNVTYAAADPVVQTLTVNKAALTITADDKLSTYGDASLPATTVTYSGFVNSETESVLTSEPLLNTTAMTGDNAGTYPITVSGATAANYTINHVDGTMTINRTTLTITADNKASTYGDAIPTLTLAYAGFVNSEDETVLNTSPVVATTATSTSDAGTYAITLSGATSNNYSITEVNGTLTIDQATLTVTADDQSKTYGSVNPSLTFTYSGFVGSDNATVFDTAPTASTTATTTSSVGTYAITVGSAVDNNYAFTYADGTLTVTKAMLTVTTDDQSKSYGDANPGLSLAYAGFQSTDDENVLDTAPTASTTATTTSGVGSYAITASGGVDNNYEFTYVGGSLTVDKAALTITGVDQSISYGDDIPSLSVKYAGFVNDEGATELLTQPTASTTATSTSDAGTYAIMVSGATATNYSITEVSGTMTIGQATLTVTADDQSKTYGDANPTLSLTYSGFLNGDDESSLTTAPTATTTTTTTSSVGTYAIIASGGVADNYTFDYASGTLAVSQATLTVTAADQSRTYGGGNPNLSLSYAGFMNGEDESVLDVIPTASTLADVLSAVGTYTISVSGRIDDNYLLNFVDGTLTITQAALTITADDQTRLFGSSNPTFTATYSGFVNDENASVLSTQPTITTTADATSAPGTYVIAVSGAEATNYSITHVENVLTVTKAEQEIAFDILPVKTSADEAFELTATATSDLVVSYTSDDETVATVNGSTVTIVGAGSTLITASQAGDDNYNAAQDVVQQLVVTQANDTRITSSIEIDAVADQTIGAGPITLTATIRPVEAPISWEIISGPATLNGDVLTLGDQAGLVQVKGSIKETTEYKGSEDVVEFALLDVDLVTPIIDFILPAEALNTETLTLAATVDAQGATTVTGADVIYSVVSGPGEISTTNELTFTDIGRVIVSASLPATTESNAIAAQSSVEVIALYEITGTIRDENGNAFTEGLVIVGDLNDFTNSQTTVINADGTYTFSQLRSGDYELLVTPFTIGYVMTFYGDVSPVIDPAVVPLGLNITSDLTNVDVTMQLAPQSNVDFLPDDQGGVINFFAQNNQGNGNRFMLDRIENGDPLPNTLVILKTAADEYVAADVTNDLGLIEFKGLPTGDYKLLVDIPGVGTMSADVGVIEGEQIDVTALIDDSGAAFNVDEVLSTIPEALKEIRVYPNPVQDYFEIRSLQQVEQVQLYDLNGRMVQRFENEGKYNIRELPEGLYMVQITTNEGTTIKRLMKQ